MKHVLVIGKHIDAGGRMPQLKEMRDFIAGAINDDNVEVSFCRLDEMEIYVSNDGVEITDGHSGRPFSDYKLAIFRSADRRDMNILALLAAYAGEHGITVLNSSHAKRRALGKISQMYQAAEIGLPIPRSLHAGNHRLPELIEKYFGGYPVVVKDNYGGLGDINFLVKSRDELDVALAGNEDIRFIVQEVIPNEGDYRVLIVGPEEHLVIHRKGSPDTHLNNTSQGGTATLADVTEIGEGVLGEARAYAQACSYDIAGVDVIVHRETGKHYYLEVNSLPQIANGAFVPEKGAVIGAYLRQLLADD